MCDPVTLAILGTSVLSGVLGMSQSSPAPPPAAAAPAAVAAPTARDAGATVLVGDGKSKDTGTDTPASQLGFTEKRKEGIALGGLGRSGLAL